jgi:hypothetical protein
LAGQQNDLFLNLSKGRELTCLLLLLSHILTFGFQWHGNGLHGLANPRAEGHDPSSEHDVLADPPTAGILIKSCIHRRADVWSSIFKAAYTASTLVHQHRLRTYIPFRVLTSGSNVLAFLKDILKIFVLVLFDAQTIWKDKTEKVKIEPVMS